MALHGTSPLSVEIHMGGAYANEHVHPKNKKVDRIDRCLVENQLPDMRCVFVMHQKANVVGYTIQGSNKTISVVNKEENQTDVGKLADLHFQKGSVICADESRLMIACTPRLTPAA